IHPFPRKLAPNAQATLSGRLAPGYDSPKMNLTDPAGRLEAPSLGSGPDFQSEIRCADKPGTIRIELRGQHNGTENILASFPAACGTEQPTAVTLAARTTQAAASSGPPERRLFEMINSERTQAGLPALQYDEAVAEIAKSVSEANRDQMKGGSEAKKVDIVGRLKSEGIQSPLVLSNPGAARSPEEVQQRFASSPVHRANYMSTEVTHVGIGTAQAADTAGEAISLHTDP